MLFTFLLIFLPSQLGLHFWPNWSIVNGLRLDYFSPTLYLTDILVILFIISNFKFKILKEFFKSKTSIYLFILFICFIIVNTYCSLSPLVTLYKWFKFFELFIFGYLIFLLKFKIKIWNLLLIPIFYISLLTIWQFFTQSSIGGLWYFLGERTFNSITPGIANAFINGQLIMRPYATFSHPNQLGGFLAITLPLILAHLPQNNRKLTVPIIILGYLALFLSLSRSAILIGIFATLFILRKKSLALLSLIALLFLLPRFISLNTEIEPITMRQTLNSLAITNWQHSPIIGTGLGTSPLYGPKLHFQPPHNIFLLILSETGLLGLMSFIFLIFVILKHSLKIVNCKLKIILISILFLGLFDHYWLTLQQTQLLFAIIIGIIL